MGVEAPYLLLPDMLDRIDVQIAGKPMSLCDALMNKNMFIRDENQQLWELASRLWSQNNDKIFVWRGTGVNDSARTPILDAIELPLQLLRNSQLSRFNWRQIKTALQCIKKNDPLQAELIIAEAQFNALAKALEKRNGLLKRHGFMDTHPELSKLMH